MTHTFRTEFTDDFIASVSRKRLLRRAGMGMAVLSGAALVGTLAAWFAGVAWLAISFATLAFGACALTLFAYVRVPREGGKGLAHLDSRVVTYTFDSDGYDIDSGLGHGRYRWDAVQRIEKWPDVWLLIQRDGRALTLPKDQLPDDLRRLIQTNMSAAQTA